MAARPCAPGFRRPSPGTRRLSISIHTWRSCTSSTARPRRGSTDARTRRSRYERVTRWRFRPTRLTRSGSSGPRPFACWGHTPRPSASCSTRTARRATHGAIVSTPEGGHHLVRQDAQRPEHAVHREQAAGIELDDESVEAELGRQHPEPFLQHAGGAEGHALFQNLVVVHRFELRQARLVAVERAGVVATQARARELLVALEEIGDVLARLLERLLLGGRRVHRNAQTNVAVAGMAGLAPRLPVRLEILAQLGQIDVAQADEELETGAADPR